MDQKTIRDKLCNDFPSIYIKEIINLAPKEFQKNYKNLPEDLEDAFNKYL